MSKFINVLVLSAIALPALAKLPETTDTSRVHHPTYYHMQIKEKINSSDKKAENEDRIPQIELFHEQMRRLTSQSTKSTDGSDRIPQIEDYHRKMRELTNQPNKKSADGSDRVPQIEDYHKKMRELLNGSKETKEKLISLQFQGLESCISTEMAKGRDHGAAYRYCMDRKGYRSLFSLALAADANCVKKAIASPDTSASMTAVRSCADNFMNESLESIGSCKQNSPQQLCLRGAMSRAVERANAEAPARVVEAQQAIR